MGEIEEDKIELAFKICVFGNTGVGKTSLVDHYLTNEFHENIQATLGASIHIKFMKVTKGKITLQIWDFGVIRILCFSFPLMLEGLLEQFLCLILQIITV